MASNTVDVDELGAKWDEMQIEDEEDSGIPFDGSMGTQAGEFTRLCLIGKLLSERIHDFDALKIALASFWRPVKGMVARKLEPNRFLFQFFHEKDLNRVMEGSPWTFNKAPLLLERLQEEDDPWLMQVTHLEIWVQVYGLRVGFIW